MSGIQLIKEVVKSHDISVDEINQLNDDTIMQLMVILYQPIEKELTSKSPYAFPEYIRTKLTHVTYFLIEYTKLENQFHQIEPYQKIVHILGCLPSYRNLQNKLQVRTKLHIHYCQQERQTNLFVVLFIHFYRYGSVHCLVHIHN